MPNFVLSAARISLAVALLPFMQYVVAQPALNLSGQVVALGAERRLVLTRLKGFRLQCIGESSSSIDKCASVLVQGASAPYDAYANVYFRQDRVESVRKYWSRGFEGMDPQAFARTLFTVVSQLSHETGIAPTITTSERRDPGVVQQTIFISAGRRSVEIWYAEGLPGADGITIAPFVNLSEKVE